jgi:hypothetical protein
MSAFGQRFAAGADEAARDFPELAYLTLRAAHIVAGYRKRRDRYFSSTSAMGLAYDPAAVATETAHRMATEGLAPTGRAHNDPIHTVAFFPLIGWHPQLLDALRRLGPVQHFDYVAHGLSIADLVAGEPRALAQRREACAAFEAFVENLSREHPIDWVFVYASGLEILGSTLDRVRKITGAPIVGMCLDDKQSWKGPLFGEQRVGQIDIARHFDLAWTSARVACEWYLVEGGNPLFLPEGCSPDLFHPADVPQDLDVTFVGAAYGYRPLFIEALKKAGVRVATAGPGWPTGPVDDAEMVRLMQRSKIILGLGGIGWSEDLKNVKGRDFDAPCVGPFLTSYNPDLAPFFRMGEEIACYSSRDEAVELARELLSVPKRRRDMAHASRARCLAEHTWTQRFETVLKILGVRAA